MGRVGEPRRYGDCPVARPRSAPVPTAVVGLDGAFELGLRHGRPAVDALLASLVVELVVGPAARARVRAQPAAAARRDVVERRPAGGDRLARPGPLLVHRSGRDLLGLVLAPAALAQAFANVLVLALALVGPAGLRHEMTSVAAVAPEASVAGPALPAA